MKLFKTEFEIYLEQQKNTEFGNSETSYISDLYKKQFKNEKQLQGAVIMMISQRFPRLRNKTFHPKNEDWKRRLAIQTKDGWRAESDSEYKERCMREGSQDKAQGLLSGIPDIIIFHNGVRFGIELKVEHGVLSDSQKEIHISLNNDCPQIPIVVFKNIVDVYFYCKFIMFKNYKIDFR